MSAYYQDDLVTLYHGDCLEVTAWLEADVLVTDPPYGRAWTQPGIADRGPSRVKLHARDGIANDHDTTTRDAALVLWGDERPSLVFGDLMLAPPDGTRQVAIYRKPPDAGTRGCVAKVRRDVEAIYLRGSSLGTGIGGRTSVFITGAATVGNPVGLAARNGHPHAKPQDVLEALLALLPDGTIADPFVGSGSTLVAAKALGRKAIGVELEERYCEIAAKRLAQDTLFGGDQP